MSAKLREIMNDIFYNVQVNKTCHKRYIKRLTNISQQYELELFLEEFISCLKIPLSMSQNHISIDNTLQFAAKYAVSSYASSDGEACEPMSPFLEKLFEFVLTHHNAKDSSVRFRICHFLNMLLNSMGENAFIDDALCDKITVNMMDRLLDKSHKVRAQAVFALHRLQDPSDENCPVIKMYIFHLSKDPKVEVRKAVLSSMAKNQKTLHAALKRIRDVSDIVRKMAYDFISKITIRSLTIKQRIQLLNEGLKDRAEIVRKCVENVLLPIWLRYYNGEYIDLIHALDAEIGTNVSILALNVLFKKTEIDKLISQIPIDETTKLIPINKLTSENCLYWRCVAKHFHSLSSLDALEKILPELSSFSAYINEFLIMISSETYEMLEKTAHQFILLQLFEIIKVYDLSDEAGRNNLSELILNVLLTDHCSKEIIECIVNHLENVIPDVNKRLDLLSNTISKIRTPIKVTTQVIKEISPKQEHRNNMQKARLRVQLLELKEEEYQAIQNKEYLKAENRKEQIDKINQELMKLNEQSEPNQMIVDDDIEEEKSDSETMIKCLTIMCAMMRVKSVKTLTPTLRCLVNVALSSLDHPDDRVHILALEALGIFCILDKELARTNILTFLLQFSLEQEKQEIWIITLKALFDLLLYYGLEFFDISKNDDNSSLLNKTNKPVKLFNQMEEEDITVYRQSSNSQVQSPDIMKILIGLLDNVNQDLRTIATEGLCKLLINRRINSSTLLARIIIMYYNPTNRDDIYLCQCISSFFDQFIMYVPFNQEMLEEAFFPVLKIICNAPEISPLQEINPYNVAAFILNLTRNRGKGSESMNTYCVHNNLAFAILAEILNSDSKIDKDVLIKCLKDLDIQIDDNLSQEDLKDGIEKVSLMVNKFDKRFLNYVQKFKKKLESPGFIETQEEVENNTDTEE
ncbi:condensin complex subunit 3-like [Vespa mandarinia]|uniref:condensin complex subunit 3-like n=1 Tax=Vespa mandarinia TaxID=7446 RepID=UPI00160FD1B7|nr:condensin complex subunit 3-like [Vespa mandarinia]